MNKVEKEILKKLYSTDDNDLYNQIPLKTKCMHCHGEIDDNVTTCMHCRKNVSLQNDPITTIIVYIVVLISLPTIVYFMWDFLSSVLFPIWSYIDQL